MDDSHPFYKTIEVKETTESICDAIDSAKLYMPVSNRRLSDDRITPVSADLPACLFSHSFKILLFPFKVLNGMAPRYLLGFLLFHHTKSTEIF